MNDDLARKMYLAETAVVRDHLAGQTTPLRNRIAKALEDAPFRPEERRSLQLADAVLAVLPEPTDQVAGFDPQARILGLENELERMRHLLRSQNQRANATTALKETAEQAPPIDLTTLAPLFEGFARLLSTSSRDWGQYAPDAWLYAVICGWDCEETAHNKSCVHGAMEEMAERHGWDDATVAKARRYRATVRAITEGAAVPPAPADRTAVLGEAADHAEIVALRLRLKHDYGAANGAFEVMAELRRMADETATTEAQARRGDAFEAWLKQQRDRYDRHGESSEFWHEFDRALDEYRLHADLGTPLDGHVCEGQVVGDCECLEQPAAGARQDGARP